MIHLSPEIRKKKEAALVRMDISKGTAVNNGLQPTAVPLWERDLLRSLVSIIMYEVVKVKSMFKSFYLIARLVFFCD